MYTAIHRQQILTLAKNAIQYGLEHCERMQADHSVFPAILLEPKATFVTLKIGDNLRGCMGNLTAHESLVDSVSSNAFNAAFQDPRFPGLEPEEVGQLSINVSLLSSSQRIYAASEEELLQQLVPEVDGIILKEGTRSSTFLPDVWKKIPQPDEFLKQLKRKAGLPENYWSKSLVCERYTAISIGR